jgi:hypothetical protein
MTQRWMACALLLAMVGCGSGSSGSTGVRLGSPPLANASGGGGGTPPPPPAASSAAIVIDGVHVTVPSWFMLADTPNLAVAFDQYIQDARANLAGWLPDPGNPPTSPPLEVIFHDVTGMNYWDITTRTAWLEWPKGPTPLPVRTRFAPLIGQVLVYDRRRAQGIPVPTYDPVTNSWMNPFTVEEENEMTSSLNLAVTMDTFYPSQYEVP